MKSFTTNDRIYAVFLALWLVINLFSAAQLELYSDEAYYWMYSKHLSWGYFDHPPAVALLIAIGAPLGKSELAVRIGTVFMSTGALALLYLLIKPEQVYRFILILFSFLVLHIIGFMALPDVPFFFFSLCCIYAYKRYLDKSSWGNALCFGFFAALMIYGKYHGAVVLLFIALSNLRLFRDPKMYGAAAAALLLLSPHLYWQYANDFPSLQYHLVDRASSTYSIDQTLEYVGTNLLFLGGVVSVILFVFSFKTKAENAWERALKWNLNGTLLFFLLYTFRGQHIEPNWTIFCVLPILYFGLKGIELTPKFQPWFNGMVIFSAVLMLVMRVHLLHPFWDSRADRTGDFYMARTFVRQVDSIAAGRILVAQRYQEASLLNFYLNKPYPITSANIDGRHNQYDLWTFDTLFRASQVAFVNSQSDGIEVEARYHRRQYVHFLDSVSSFQAITLDYCWLGKMENRPGINCMFHRNLSYPLASHDYYLRVKYEKGGELLGTDLGYIELNSLRQFMPISDSLYQDLNASPKVYIQIESRTWRGTNQLWKKMDKKLNLIP